jgi:hypothetical protein
LESRTNIGQKENRILDKRAVSSEDDTLLDRTHLGNCPEYDRIPESRTTECKQENRRIWDRFTPEYWSGGWQNIGQEDGKTLGKKMARCWTVGRQNIRYQDSRILAGGQIWTRVRQKIAQVVYF